MNLEVNHCNKSMLFYLFSIIIIIWYDNSGPTVSLNSANEITMYGAGENESLIVVDAGANQVVHLNNVDSSNRIICLLARNWTGGNTFLMPCYAFIDTHNTNDVYVSDYGNNRVILFSSIQINNSIPWVVASLIGSVGSTLGKLDGATGVTLDKGKNLYAADLYNHRIVRWVPNVIAGILIAGSGTSALIR